MPRKVNREEEEEGRGRVQVAGSIRGRLKVGAAYDTDCTMGTESSLHLGVANGR